MEDWYRDPRIRPEFVKAAGLAPPPLGGWVETRTVPRVPHRPLTSGRCLTRGHSPPARRGEQRPLQGLPACGLCVRSPAFPWFSFSLYIPHSALCARNSFSRLALQKRVSPGFRFPVPRSRFPAFGSYPQRRMPIRPCHKPSNSGQNRSKGRRFPIKSDQNRAHFVMPILTFWGWTPSGGGARAVWASRKGKKGAFSGAPRRVPKLSTIAWRSWTATPGREWVCTVGQPAAGIRRFAGEKGLHLRPDCGKRRAATAVLQRSTP